MLLLLAVVWTGARTDLHVERGVSGGEVCAGAGSGPYHCLRTHRGRRCPLGYECVGLTNADCPDAMS